MRFGLVQNHTLNLWPNTYVLILEFNHVDFKKKILSAEIREHSRTDLQDEIIYLLILCLWYSRDIFVKLSLFRQQARYIKYIKTNVALVIERTIIFLNF